MGAVTRAREENACELIKQYQKINLVFLLFISFLFLSSLTLAQPHEMHGISNSGGLLDSNMPADNEVLAKVPQSIMLNFSSEVRLVKLALKETKQGEILIDFRYDPTAAMRYMHTLPRLEAADYYKVEWAALKASGELVKGSFYFSFGDDAKPPSEYLNEMDHEMMIMSPDYRLL
ncbi:MAG: copper resistance protein CopC [Gammaproteobacteria bacterium]|nr:copper resistance protein CopC [Gammaproteobacteria bacterium]